MTKGKIKKLFSLEGLKSLVSDNKNDHELELDPSMFPKAVDGILEDRKVMKQLMDGTYKFNEGINFSSFKKKKSNPLGKKDSRTLRKRNKFHPTRDYYYWPPGLSNRKSKAIKWEAMKRNNALKRLEQATRRRTNRLERLKNEIQNNNRI